MRASLFLCFIYALLCFRLEHIRLHEKHRGHESMHAEMVLILFATLVVSQIALVKWRQVYPKSYHVSIYTVVNETLFT